ncbi:MAG: disulfide reductase [Methanohalobium sp.]|uniref:disulfide reductase n=1 Tax=Methanohalobium sp. TaxID=2837493 RepID=UPI00397A2DA2
MSMEYFSGISDAMRITFVQVMILSVIAIGIFLYGMYLNIKKWGLGTTGYAQEPGGGGILVFPKTFVSHVAKKGDWKLILKTLVLDILLQRRIIKISKLRWVMHITIFVGWMTLFALSLLMFLIELLSLSGVNIHPEAFRQTLQPWNDLFSYLLLFGIIVAIFRRLFVKRARESTIAYDAVLIAGLTFIVITGFIAQGIRIGDFWALGIEWGVDAAPQMALFHAVISLLFCIAYIPFSKYIHIIATPLTILANVEAEEGE